MTLIWTRLITPSPVDLRTYLVLHQALVLRHKTAATTPCEHQLDFTSFGISTDPPHTRTTIPRYQQTDLLSMNSSPLLRFKVNLTPEEKTIDLNFRTNDSGTSFTYQSQRNTPLKQALTWVLLFLFFVGLARLISKADGVGLWMLVLALGLRAGDLTRVR